MLLLSKGQRIWIKTDVCVVEILNNYFIRFWEEIDSETSDTSFRVNTVGSWLVIFHNNEPFEIVFLSLSNETFKKKKPFISKCNLHTEIFNPYLYTFKNNKSWHAFVMCFGSWLLSWAHFNFFPYNKVLNLTRIFFSHYKPLFNQHPVYL